MAAPVQVPLPGWTRGGLEVLADRYLKNAWPVRANIDAFAVQLDLLLVFTIPAMKRLKDLLPL